MSDTELLSADIRETRKDIGKLHDKIDGYAQKQTTMVHQMDMRLTVLEQRPVIKQPCSFFLDHEAKEEAHREKWLDRFWGIAVKYVPTVAALAAAGYVALKTGNLPVK